MDPIEKILINLRVKQLLDNPSFGPLLIRQDIKQNSSWCESFTSDGLVWYYNKDYVKKFKAQNVVYFMYHSLFHCLLNNMIVPDGYEQPLWDIASDLEVIYTIHSLNLVPVPDNISSIIREYKPLFANKSAEEIYKLIEINGIDPAELSCVHQDIHLKIKDNNIEKIDLSNILESYTGNIEEESEEETKGSLNEKNDKKDKGDENSDEGNPDSDGNGETESEGEGSEEGDSGDNPGEGEGDGEEEEGDPEGESDSNSDSKKSNKSSKKSTSSGDSSGEGNPEDADESNSENNSESDPPEVTQENIGVSGSEVSEQEINPDNPPILNEDEVEKITREFSSQLINVGNNEADKFPGNMLRLIKEYTEPKLDWRSILRNTMSTIFDKDDYNFKKPSKRSYCLGEMKYILPSQSEAKTIDICVSLDTSGSITDEIFMDFLTEVRSIIENYNDYKLHIWCIDSEIYCPKIFTPDNIHELESYEFVGGGGNDFPLNWEFMKENDIVPELLVVFSDGYPCSKWGYANYCETIFVIRNEHENITAPFGTTVQMIPNGEERIDPYNNGYYIN